LQLKIYRRVIDDWREVGRQPIAAEAARLAVPYDFLGHKKIIKNTSRKDF
jgi:hypothetical protein